jgi:nucleoside-triphosphatase THEP1
MNIVVTGEIGIGKTTVCEKVLGMAQDEGRRPGGVLTYKALEDGVIRGIEVLDVGSGRREVLASVDDVYGGPRVGRYFFNPAGVEFGIDAVERGRSSDLLVVDEIGPLEFEGGGFSNALGLIVEGRVRNCVAVVRAGLLPAFLARLAAQPAVFETTFDNRDEVPQRVYASLTF